MLQGLINWLAKFLNAGGTAFKVEQVAGSAVVGSVSINQTTDGTTNKVQARNATHGNFQVNATMQINDADVSASVPVPVEGNAKTVYATTAVAASGVIKTLGTAVSAGTAAASNICIYCALALLLMPTRP